MHAGIRAIGEHSAEVKSTALRSMARIGAGGDPAARGKALDRVLASISRDDRYWPELLAAGLAEVNKIGSANAHAVAFACALEHSESEVAGIIVNGQSVGMDEQYQSQATRTLMQSSPALRARMETMRVNSDDIAMRVFLAYFFRRDISAPFQMFIIDQMVKPLVKALKTNLTLLVRQLIERPELSVVPDGVSGMVFCQFDGTGRAGYFLRPLDEAGLKALKVTRDALRNVPGFDADDDFAVGHELMSTGIGYLIGKDLQRFSMLASMAFHVLGISSGVVSIKGLNQEGKFRQLAISEIRAASAQEAREKFLKDPMTAISDLIRETSSLSARDPDADPDVAEPEQP